MDDSSETLSYNGTFKIDQIIRTFKFYTSDLSFFVLTVSVLGVY